MGSVLFKKINVVDVRQQRILPSMDVLVEGKKKLQSSRNISQRRRIALSTERDCI